MNRIKLAALVGGLIAAFMVLGLTAGTAIASDSQDCTTTTVNDTVATVCSEKSSTASVSIKYNFIGTWDMITSPIRKLHGHRDCYWASGTWTNSVRTASGIKHYKETSRAKFCMLKHPVTINGITYPAVKVAGGLTNSPCFNLAIPPGYHQPKGGIKGPVLDVRSMNNINLVVPVKAEANSSVTATWNCPSGTLSASASGSASIDAKIKIHIEASLLLKSKGWVNASVKAAINEQIRTSIEASATASAFSKITVSCGGSPPQGPSVKITGQTTLNDIPEGKNSGPFYYEIDSSVAQTDGFTVDPGTGGVSDCNSSTPNTHGSMSFNLNAGHTEVCVIFYAPTDASANSMTVTGTATVHDNGQTAQDQKVQTFPISHPVGPLKRK